MESPSPLQEPPLDLEAAIKEVTNGYELSSELHSLLRQVIPRGDGRLESACRLSKEVQQILASALSILRPTAAATTAAATRKARFRGSDPLALEISLPSLETGERMMPSTVAEAKETEVEDKNRKDSRKRNLHSGTTITNENSNEGQHRKTNGEKKASKTNKLQRIHLHSWTTSTCTPFNDGHQWRKYGEKKISNCEMTRCYYRCTHKDDQGCPATKQVQQKDYEDPPTFVVTYNKPHTCKNRNLLHGEQFVVKPPTTDPCQLSL